MIIVWVLDGFHYCIYDLETVNEPKIIGPRIQNHLKYRKPETMVLYEKYLVL